jgi:hypothetical protein
MHVCTLLWLVIWLLLAGRGAEIILGHVRLVGVCEAQCSLQLQDCVLGLLPALGLL